MMYGGNPIIFDIETVPDRFDDYARAFPKSKKKPGLHAIISRVVAIGYEADGHRGVIMGEEEEILRTFACILDDHKTASLVGYNIKNFDISVLKLRAARYDIKMPFPDKRSQRIVDLYDMLGGKWVGDTSSCSLSELGWYFYGVGKKTDGGDIATMWAQGDLAGIREHCDEDVETTSRIYNEFLGMLW